MYKLHGKILLWQKNGLASSLDCYWFTFAYSLECQPEDLLSDTAARGITTYIFVDQGMPLIVGYR